MGLIALLNSYNSLQLRVYSRLVRKEFAPNSGPFRLHPSVRVNNSRHIFLGRGVNIGRGSWIYAMTSDGAGTTCAPSIHIGNNTKIGDYLHLTCANKVHLGENLLITQGVLITDSNHVYEDTQRPIIAQGLTSHELVIGDGTWIGNNAAIIGAVRIGKNCVIAANAVVTKDVPDYCVVGGAPARILKRYDASSGQWQRVGRDGNIIPDTSGAPERS